MAGAPKGNLYALGNSGKPPFYETPEEMGQKLSEYIDFEDSCKGGLDANGLGKGLYTLEGAALFLGFASRQSWYDYSKRAEFSYILDRFKLFLTNWNVKKLYWAGTMPGAKFWLTNHGGYTEESVVNQNQTINHVTITEKKRDGE